MTYIDWEFYSSLYSEIKLEEEFDKYVQKAEMRLDIITHRKAKEYVLAYDESEATDFQKFVIEAIKTTMCDLVNALYSQEENAVSNSLASVSNDGYSESYRVVTQSDRDNELRHIVNDGLSGTGLAGAL